MPEEERMHEVTSPKLRPAVVTSAAAPPEEAPERLSPILWPLAAYLAIGTLVLFLVSQLDGVATAVAPWEGERNRWHESSAGWIALFPLTAPVLVIYGLTRIGFAIPARAIELVWRCARALGRYLSDAWAAVRVLVRRTREAIDTMLRDAMRAVKRAAETTVRRVRAALSRASRR
jgi:hypothetical protein